MTQASVTCPVSAEKINENVARIIASFTIIIVLAGLYFKSPFIIAALAIDFSLRAFTNGNYSPLKYISKRFSNYFGTDPKMVDAAPKKFAAGIGFLFTVTIAGLQWFQHDISTDLVATALLICAGLESFKGFCLGCIVYTYIVLPFISKEDSEQSTISINL
jgi:flagellar biosynthesis protein FliR